MEQFFVTGALPSGSITLDQLFSYNLLLVLVSFLLASFGSYVAIWVLRISIDSSDALKKIGVLIGAVVMATAIWSMHYTGMLSYNMTMVHTYDPLLTAFSGLLAFLFSYAVFYFLIMHQMTSRIILVSAPLLGLGVATMHYSGMEAMQMDARLLYKPDLFALSLVIAVTASAAALWMMNGITQLTKHRHTAQIVAACIMGIAVCGMHYAGMAASVFIPFADCRFDFNQSFVDFSLAVSTMAFLVMGIAIAFLYYALQFKKKGSLTNEFVMLARFLYGTLSLVAVVITVTALMTYDIHLTLKDLSKNEAEDTKLHTEIVYLSKFLTMSATMAAKTGEPEWEVQYDSHAAQLQKKIKLAIERHPVKYSELGIGKADEAYGELTKIKKQVFAFVKSGQLEQAVLLMESDNHARYKRQYLDGIQSFSKVISQLAEGQIKQINQQSNLLLFIVFPGLVALMVGFFALLHGRKFVKHTLFERHFNQKILDAIADPVFVKGDNHEWKRGNRAFGKLIGGDQDDYVDTHYSDFFVSETQEELWQREDGVIDLGTTDINEEQIRLPNDDFIDAVVTRSPLTLSDGSRGLVGIVHDITHLKKVEVELGEHKDNLERLVEVQTKSLQAALEEAKQVSELKSDFLSNMSHELRTPLNSIIGMSSLMLEEPLNSGQEEMMSTLETSSKNLLEIVNDILDLSKIESGALELEHIAFDAQQTISNVIDMLAPMASQKDVNLYWHGKGLAPIFVMGDPLRYARIVTNLVSNAVKYTDAGQVDVSLDTTQLDGGGRMLKLIIKDTGIGMNAEAVERVFDKFTQADTSTTRRYGGSGLGLAITKQLVDKMQGKITIESAPGLGSEFAVAIPFELCDGTSVEQEPVMHFNQCGILKPSATRILVAEDHKLNQVFIRKMLQSAGFEDITIVENGALAVEEILEEEPDIVLMDCHMPEMNGYDATKAIRAKGGNYAHLPIVALTANAMEGEKERCIEIGMDDYLSKPVEKAKLVSILSRWVNFSLSDHVVTAKPASKPKAKLALLDMTSIKSFSGDDEELEKEFVQIFVAQSISQLEELSRHIVDGSSQAWVETSHLLKGGSATMGAYQMRELCSKSQEMFNTSFGDREEIYIEIQQAFTEVRQELYRLGLLETN